MPYSKEMVGKPRRLIRMGISCLDVATKARNLCRLYRFRAYRVSFKYRTSQKNVIQTPLQRCRVKDGIYCGLYGTYLPLHDPYEVGVNSTHKLNHQLTLTYVHRSAKVDAPGCVNAAGKLRQKW